MLPCEECTKTNNHCCKMDIPYHPVDAMWFIKCGEDVGINDLVLINHPKFNDMVIIANKNTYGDIQELPCVFLKDGKCAIYNNRPIICRSYGTEFIRCRFEACNIASEDTIKSFKLSDIKRLDEYASNLSTINNYTNKFR